jgi:hypothetical protein
MIFTSELDGKFHESLGHTLQMQHPRAIARERILELIIIHAHEEKLSKQMGIISK